MLKKMIIIAIATAAAVWVFAEPGTWGKEPSAEKTPAPGVQFGRWLNDFRAAYEQRDGEKMEQLIKGSEEKQRGVSAMPRIEKWLTNVKAAYQEQDVRKMGRLLENADRVRERIRGRNQQNFMERRGRGDENFGKRGRRFDNPQGQDFGAPGDRPDFGRQRGYNRQRDNFRPGNNEGRPEQFRSRGGMPGRFFEGCRPMYRPETPYGDEFERPYFRHEPRGEFGRRGIGPMDGRYAPPQGSMRQRLAPRMRSGFGPRYDGPRNYPQDWQSQEYDRTVPRDFWY